MKKKELKENGMNQSFLKKKSVVVGFSIVAFLCGFFFLFLNNSLTGNVILEEDMQIITRFISVIGLVLIVCAFVLAWYSIRKK